MVDPAIGSMYGLFDDLPTSGEKMPHSRGNLGKYTVGHMDPSWDMNCSYLEDHPITCKWLTCPWLVFVP